jgi:hypothetical protein
VFIGELLQPLRTEQQLEIHGSCGPIGLRYAVSWRCRVRAARLLEISGQVGPAPAWLEPDTAMSAGTDMRRVGPPVAARPRRWYRLPAGKPPAARPRIAEIPGPPATDLLTPPSARICAASCRGSCG